MTAPNWGELVTPVPAVHTPPASPPGAQLPSQQQLLEWGAKLIEGIVRQVVLGLTGAILPGPLGAQLQNFANGILDNFGTIFDAFDGIDLTNPGAIVGAITAAIAEALDDIPVVGEIADLINNLVNGGQPINVLNLFGSLPQTLFGLIPASAIGSTNPNLLNNGGFDGSISMDGDGVWLWDAAVGRTTTGAASTVANGSMKALLSNAVSVAAGQKLTPSVWARTSGYAGSGTPLRLGVRTYLNGAVVGTSTIQSIAGPGTTWTQLTGTYTVPSGVDQVRLRLVVDTTATAGTVWYDDATLTKPGNGPFDGILDLFGLGALDDLFNIDVADIWSQIISLFLNPLGLLEDITARNGLGSLLTDLLGSPDTVIGDLPDTIVSGVRSLLDNLFGGITKLGGSGHGHAETAAAVASQADTIVGTTATMEQILAALGSGTPDADDFERTSSSNLGANWNITQTGSGTLATPNGHDAAFSGTGNVEYIARKTDKTASTDHQTVSQVLATGIPSYPLFTPLPYGGNNDLWVRMTGFTTWATRTGLRFRINSAAPYAATWAMHWVSAGSETQLATGSCTIPAAGAAISFEVGVGGNMRHYTARLNGSPIADFTDSVDRGFGNAFRGFGGKGTAGFGVPQGTAKLKQWTAQG